MTRFWPRRPRPNVQDQLDAEKQRTGFTTTTWFNQSDLNWWCRVDGMAGHFVANSEDQAASILLVELRRCPTRTELL